MKLQEAKEVPQHITEAFDLVIEYMEEQAHESPDAHARVTQLKYAIQHLGLFVKKSMEEYARMSKADNELIAEFMGFRVDGPEYENRYVHFKDSNPVLISKLQYDTSWDWLMPVVKRIFDVPYVEFSEQGDYNSRLAGRICDVDLTGAYEAVVAFIKWYKNQNSA